MIAAEPVSPTHNGLCPATSAGTMNFTTTIAAKPRPRIANSPRRRATATVAKANSNPMATSGKSR